jgi:hypothetical protein
MLRTEIAPCFSSEEINQLAADCGFIQRRRGKIDGATFLNLIIFHKDRLKDQSLNGLCLSAYKEYGIEIKKQSLHERFNKHAVKFLSNVLERILQKHLQEERFLAKIQGFKRILIKDSTCFQVSENATYLYPGSGGSGSSAAVRIQFEFDLLSGRITALSLGAYNHQDATDAAETVELINEGELVIRDLAYNHPGVLRKIIEQLAFFISRLHPNYKVYEKRNGTLEEVDFEKLRIHMEKCGLNQMEKDVVLDKKDPVSLRLIVYLLPENEVAKRIARIRAQQKKKKRNEPTKEYLSRCHLNLFITNASKEQLPITTIYSLYKFRWMVELVFKTWKSIWGIHSIKKVSIHRLNCYIYAKLLVVITNWDIIWNLLKDANYLGRIIVSIDKCTKFLSMMTEELKGFFTGDKSKTARCITLLCKRVNELKCERRLKNKTLLESVACWVEEAPLC